MQELARGWLLAQPSKSLSEIGLSSNRAGSACKRKVSLLGMIVVLISMWGDVVSAADADPLQDFCVAASPGMPCANPSSLTGASFKSSLLRGPSPSSTSLTGVSITSSTSSSFPALNSQGLSFTRVDFLPGGLLPPHVHPRASEVLFLISGSLLVGFIDTTNTLFSTSLSPGDLFVFPRGLVHYALNPEPSPALSVSGLNSQNPGASLLPQALFTSSPSLPDQILEKAFSLSHHEVDLLKSTIPKAMQK